MFPGTDLYCTILSTSGDSDKVEIYKERTTKKRRQNNFEMETFTIPNCDMCTDHKYSRIPHYDTMTVDEHNHVFFLVNNEGKGSEINKYWRLIESPTVSKKRK
eukprot:7114370-Ditylum_brightwellii.AAC.1